MRTKEEKKGLIKSYNECLLERVKEIVEWAKNEGILIDEMFVNRSKSEIVNEAGETFKLSYYDVNIDAFDTNDGKLL